MNKILCSLITLFFLSISYAFADTKNSPSVQNDNKEEVADSKAVLPEGELLKITDNDVVIGDPKAKVIIFEYMSLSCHHCADFHEDTFPKIKEKYIDTGLVKFVFRDFPLNEPALRASQISRCAAKDKFAKFTDAFLNTQKSWVSKKNSIEVIENIAKLGGMSSEKFTSCLADKQIEEAILSSRLNAHKTLSIKSTPSFFIKIEGQKNSSKIEGGKKFDDFVEVIDRKLGTN